MAEEIKIPTEEGLAEALQGLGTLLVAKEWGRAAIVYAFTDIGGPRNSRQPDPPRMNIQRFIELGFKGLTTRKAVVRYRNAWLWAISQGLATHVDPGDTTVLPEVEFPMWSTQAETSDEDSRPSMHSPRTRRRDRGEEAFTELQRIGTWMGKTSRKLQLARLTPRLRLNVIVALQELADVVEDTITKLRETADVPLSEAQISGARERWGNWKEDLGATDGGVQH